MRNSQPKLDQNLERFLAEYDQYKKQNTDNVELMGINQGLNNISIELEISYFIAAYKFSSDLKFVRIYFDTSMFDRITKENTKNNLQFDNCFIFQDRSAKFVDKLSAIGRNTVNYTSIQKCRKHFFSK